MKKILILFLIMFGTIGYASAEPIIELAAPRVLNQKNIPDLNLDSKPASKSLSTKKHGKTHFASKKHKKVAVKPNYRQLSKLVEYGYYNYADSKLDALIAKNKKDVKAQALSIISMAKQNKLDAAQNKVSNLLKLYPKNSDLHYAQGIIYFQRTHSSNMKYRNAADKLFADSFVEFKKAMELDKTNAKAYNAAGVIALQNKNYPDAKKYFAQAIKIDEAYSMAIDNLGTIDFLENKYSDAEKKFRQALEYNSKNATAMYHLAQISMHKNDYANALYHLNNALALSPNSAAIYNLTGKALFKQGNDAAAIAALKKSTELNPELTLSYLDLANIYEKRGDKDFAIEQLKTVLNVNPNLNIAKLKIANISYSNGDYDQSISYYSQLVGTADYNDTALKGLADAYYSKAKNCVNKSLIGSNHNLLQALESINKAIAANNQDLELHLAKLKLSEITNQPDLSKIELKKITASNSNDLQSLLAKGEAYLTLNDYINAGKSFDAAINLSNTPENDFYLSEIFIYHKQFDSAQKVIAKILKNDAKNQDALSNLDYIQKSKKAADNYFKSANGILRTRNYALASEYFSRSLALNPNNAQARLALAKIYDKQKETANAILNYQAYLGLEPNAANVISIKKRILALQNKL